MDQDIRDWADSGKRTNLGTPSTVRVMTKEFQVEISFEGAWYAIGPTFCSRDDAEWRLASWKRRYGRPGDDSEAFRVVPLLWDYATPIDPAEDVAIPF